MPGADQQHWLFGEMLLAWQKHRHINLRSYAPLLSVVSLSLDNNAQHGVSPRTANRGLAIRECLLLSSNI